MAAMRDATTRTELFEASAQLARVLAAADSAGGWQPLRDIILAGLEAGGIRAGSDPEALRRAAGVLAALALTAHRNADGV
jgi:hypothetical protein